MRRLTVLVLTLIALLLVAIPAVAQTSEPPGQGITLDSLVTVAGASAAAAIVVAFAGVLVSLTAKAKRVLSAVVGLIVVVGVTIATVGASIEILIMAVLNGMIAGLAASKGQETVTEGLNHSVTARSG